jgi:hypothetical protein
VAYLIFDAKLHDVSVAKGRKLFFCIKGINPTYRKAHYVIKTTMNGCNGNSSNPFLYGIGAGFVVGFVVIYVEFYVSKT